MTSDYINVTLPLTQQGLNVIVVAVFIAIVTGVIWLALSVSDNERPDPARRALEAFGWVYAPIWMIVFAGTLWALWQVFSGGDSPLAADGFRSLGLGALIAALLGAPFVIWGTVLKHQTVMFQKEGHMTDRINKAVEQLGAEKTVKKIVHGETQETSEPNIEVRIGAILSLERIAQDSTRHDKGRDHVRVMEILCAYVRENSNDQKPQNYTKQDWSPLKNDATEKTRDEHLSKLNFHCAFSSGKIREWAQTLPKLRLDVQLALNVIGRRSATQRKVEATWPYPPNADTVWPFDLPCQELSLEPYDEALNETELDIYLRKLQAWRQTIDAYRGYRLDLSGANLQRADLSSKQVDGSDAVFSAALFENARLEGANLQWGQMKGADFHEAYLIGANIGPAQLQCAAFNKASLQGANLMGAEMQGANLRHAFIQGANLYEAGLEGASLVKALVEGADFTLARLQGTNFWRAKMAGADYTMARMEGANLTDADIRKADFSDAGMERVNLRRIQIDDQTYFEGAKLDGAAFANVNLTSARLTKDQVSVAFGDASVELPKGFERPSNWPRERLKAFIGKSSFPNEWRKWLENPVVYTPPEEPKD